MITDKRKSIFRQQTCQSSRESRRHNEIRYNYFTFTPLFVNLLHLLHDFINSLHFHRLAAAPADQVIVHFLHVFVNSPHFPRFAAAPPGQVNMARTLEQGSGTIDLIPYGMGLETNHVLPLRAVQIAMTLCALRSTFGIYHIFGASFPSREKR